MRAFCLPSTLLGATTISLAHLALVECYARRALICDGGREQMNAGASPPLAVLERRYHRLLVPLPDNKQFGGAEIAAR